MTRCDEGAHPVAQKIRETLMQPISAQGHVLTVGASIGVVEFKPGEATAEELIARADQAMYAAKRAGRAPVQAG